MFVHFKWALNSGILFLALAGEICRAQNTNICSPAKLPGNGLAQHDFLYAGEGRQEQMFIVRHGKISWSYTHPGRGEISEAVLEPNGHILFAHQFGITEITLDKKVAWNFDAPPGTEIHTAKPIGTNSVMFIENAKPAKLIVLNKSTGAHQPVQAIEVTPDKKIVWALRSWTPPADLGPSTTIQILDGRRMGHPLMRWSLGKNVAVTERQSGAQLANRQGVSG